MTQRRLSIAARSVSKGIHRGVPCLCCGLRSPGNMDTLPRGEAIWADCGDIPATV